MKYLKFLCGTLLFSIIFIEVLVFGIICEPKDVYQSSYQSLIQDKFRILMETDSPKIIMVSGSSSAFGLNQKMLEEASGYKVANLGLHAGFGHLFISELAKANINEGDIVLLGYEYGWHSENGFNDLGTDLIMSGIDDNIEMYKYIPARKWCTILGYLFTYAENKNAPHTSASGQYSREAFDPKTGQMTFERNYNMEWSKEMYGTLDISDVMISDESISYLTEYKEYVESKGASIYFVAPPIIIDSVVCDYNEFYKLKELEEAEIGIEYISDPVQYFYPSEWMSNAMYHCNSVGEDVRTEMLIEDLRNASIIE